MKTTVSIRTFIAAALASAAILGAAPAAFARDVRYNNTEVAVYVNPNEPTQLQFPGTVAGGFKRKGSALSIDKKETDLIVFGSERIADSGEAIIVRLTDGRSFSVRVHKADADNQRDDVVRIDDAGTTILSTDEEVQPKGPLGLAKAPSNKVAGLMREMMLASEFGKATIPGYRVSESYKGQTVVADGTIEAKIDRIFIGPDLWGYVIDARNMLDQSQKINPATFRLDGTRAVSAEQWELSPRPLNIEEQISRGHTAKIYIVTRSR